MSKKHWFYDSGFYRFMSGQTSSSQSIADRFMNVVNSILNKYTGAGLTRAEEAASEKQLENQRILNQEDYDRKVQFFKENESYQAQVRQMEEANLNPALMYQGGASVSASGGVGTGSASLPSSGGSDLLAALLPTITNLKKIQTDKELRQQELQIEQEKVAAYTSYLGAQTEGQNITNQWLDDMFGAQLQNIESDTEMKQANSELLASKLLTEGVQRELLRHNVKLVDAQKAAIEVQKAILQTQKKYADDYFSALAGYELALSELTSAQNTLFRKTLTDRADKAKWELLNLIVDTGKEFDIWSGDAFRLGNEGKMTEKEKTELWTDVLSGLLNTAVGLTGGYMIGKGMTGTGQTQAPILYPKAGTYNPFDLSKLPPSQYYRPPLWTP